MRVVTFQKKMSANGNRTRYEQLRTEARRRHRRGGVEELKTWWEKCLADRSTVEGLILRNYEQDLAVLRTVLQRLEELTEAEKLYILSTKKGAPVPAAADSTTQ